MKRFNPVRAEREGLEQAIHFLTRYTGTLNESQQQQAEEYIKDLQAELLGPVVDRYPAWHPFMQINTSFSLLGSCLEKMGPLDHNIFFVNGLISCPYHKENAEKIVDEVNLWYKGSKEFLAKQTEFACHVRAEMIDIPLYSTMDVFPVLIKYEVIETEEEREQRVLRLWIELINQMIQNRIHLEPWEDISYDFLGYPHGAHSSFFVSERLGRKMRAIYEQLRKVYE